MTGQITSDPTTPPQFLTLADKLNGLELGAEEEQALGELLRYQVRGCGGRERCRGVRLGRRSCCELHRCSDEYPWLQHRHAAGNRDERRLHHAPRGQPTYGCRQLITVISRTESGGASKSRPKLAERVAGAGRHGGGGAFVVHVTLGLSWRRQNRCSGVLHDGFRTNQGLVPMRFSTRFSTSYTPIAVQPPTWSVATTKAELLAGIPRPAASQNRIPRPLSGPSSTWGVPGRFCKNT